MKKPINEIRGQDTAELKSKLADLRKEQFELRFRGSAETSGKATSRSREVRRTIARILMVIGERDRTAQVATAPAQVATAPAVAAGGKATGGKRKTGQQKAGERAQ